MKRLLCSGVWYHIPNHPHAPPTTALMNLNAVIFVPALAGSVIFGFVFLLFAANYYLTVMESTGVGAKEVTWFSEPILDNAGKLAYMAWLVGLWLGPAYFIGRAATAGMDSVWLKLAIPLMVFWLCYPISQLSSLSASTIWLPLVPDVFARLAQKPAVFLGFLVLSIPVLAAFGVGFKWAFLTEGDWPLLFAGTPLLVVAGFMYARLIGRLAFALRFTRSLFPAKKKQKTKPPTPTARTEDDPEPTFSQPSDLPPINTPDEGELTGYDVKFEDDPPARPKKRVRAEAVEPDAEPERTPKPRTDAEPDEFPQPRRRPTHSRMVERDRVWTEEDDEDTSAYGVHEAEVQPQEQTPKEVLKPSEDELRLLRRDDVPKRPKQIWNLELFVFLGQQGTISAIVIASGLCGMVGVMVRIARAFNPVSGGD